VCLAAAILAMSGPWGSSSSTGGYVLPLLLRLGLPPDAAAALHGAGRVVGHLVAYGLFAVLALRAFRGDGPPSRAAVAAAAVASLALACLDEGLQSVAPGRGSGPRDVAIDALGAAIGLAAVLARGSSARRRAASAGSG
jgi:VanZ family protein